MGKGARSGSFVLAAVFLLFFVTVVSAGEAIGKAQVATSVLDAASSIKRIRLPSSGNIPPLKPYLVKNSGNHGRHDTIRDQRLMPSRPIEKRESTRFALNATSGDCDSRSIRDLKGDALINYLKQHDDEGCLKEFLWDYNDDIRTVLISENMISVLNEIETLSATYDGTNQTGIRQLMLFVHVAFYHAWYEDDEISFTENVRQAAINAFNVFAGNSHLNDFNDEAADTLYHWICAANAGLIQIDHLYYETYKSILVQFENEPDRLYDWDQRCNIDAVFYAITRNIENRRTEFISRIDQELIALGWRFSMNPLYSPDYMWIIDYAIWTLGQICTIGEHRTEAIAALTLVLDAYPRLSKPYLWVVIALDEFADCQTARPGETICRSDLIPQIEQMVFPNTFTFDYGSKVFRTSLSLDEIQVLYHTMKQVDSQFNRITERLIPLPDDPNGVLTVILYGSPTEYETYQTFLYDLSTDNGGIYIEQTGTLYTYQRTRNESYYTLEELLRHEYVHYLMGRFLIEGLWGEGQIYSGDRMRWFDEGLAEFLTWSTPSQGVKVRKILVERINWDADRLSVKEILSPTNDDFIFYRYAGLFFNYLYTYKKETLRELIGYIRNNEVEKFDTLVKKIKRDKQIEKEYQRFLDKQIAELRVLDDVSTNFPAMDHLSTNDPAHIESFFRSTRLGRNAVCSVADREMNSRFSCRGVLTGKRTGAPNFISAWTQFDTGLNELIDDLARGEINNFQGMNCSFGPIRFESNQGRLYPLTDYYCEGPLGDNDFQLLDPLAQVTEDFHQTRLGAEASCGLSLENTVICSMILQTNAYPKATRYDKLREELDNALTELQDQIYAIRPSYYRDFKCQLANIREVSAEKKKKYLLGEARCTSVIPPVD